MRVLGGFVLCKTRRLKHAATTNQASFVVSPVSCLDISERRLVSFVKTLSIESTYIKPNGQAQHITNTDPSLMFSAEGLACQSAVKSTIAKASPTPDNATGVNSVNLSCLQRRSIDLSRPTRRWSGSTPRC